MFPIVKEKIWEIPPVQGENRERADLRHKWDVSTRKMKPEAIAIIKRLQPISDPAHEHEFHVLDLLNRVSNKDRHRALHVHHTGLAGPITTTLLLNFGVGGPIDYTVTEELSAPDGLPGTAALKNGAVIDPPATIDPKAIVDMKVHGIITQAIAMGQNRGQVVIPDSLRLVLDWIRVKAVAPLSPYLHNSK